MTVHCKTFDHYFIKNLKMSELSVVFVEGHIYRKMHPSKKRFLGLLFVKFYLEHKNSAT